MYLLDTNILIYSFNGNPRVRDNFSLNAARPKYISAITYGELLYGAKKSQRQTENLAKVYYLKNLCPVLPIDENIIENYSTLKAAYAPKGIVLDDADLLIAATALAYRFVLVTHNLKHFQKIKELTVEDWAR